MRASGGVLFDPAATRDDQFTGSDGSRLPIRMMNAHGKYRYAWFEDFQAIDLPFGKGAFSMLVLLPAQGRTPPDDLVNALNASAVLSLQGALVERELDVSNPRIELDSDTSLNDALSAMGMPIAFTPAADFTRLSSGGWPFLSELKHKTFVAVDEKGT